MHLFSYEFRRTCVFCSFYIQTVQEEDLGTEYLVRPVGEVEDEDDASDFDPEENGLDEEEGDEEIEEDDVDEDISLSAGKSEPLSKRKRVAKDHSEQGDVTGDNIRPSKR